MGKISLFKFHSVTDNQVLFDVCIMHIEVNEFQSTAKQKHLSIGNIKGKRFQVEIILQGLREQKQIIPLPNSGYDTEFRFQKSAGSGSYTISLFNLPMQPEGTNLVGEIWLKKGKVRVVAGKEADKPIKSSAMKDKDLPEVNELVELASQKHQHLQRQQESIHAIRERKKIYVTQNSFRCCERCLNLRDQNICTVHKIQVDTNNMCARYYPYSVRSGGSFSPR